MGEEEALSNRELGELLSRAADEQERGHRQEALRKAGRAALFDWPEEAGTIVEEGRSLTELPRVGPWVARLIRRFLEEPPRAEERETPALRSGFLTLAEVRATLDEHPGWPDGLRADLQMHTTNSDGKATVLDMARRCSELGYGHVLVTDHSKSLRIARGMDEERLARQAEEIAEANRTLSEEGMALRVLHGIEMDLDGRGDGDMDPDALATLDVVLGAFHTALRSDEDQTARYVAALHNPTVHVLAHPRTRKHGRRAGIRADWELVVQAAAATGRALEIDAFPDRQDLDVATLELAREAGCTISIGTDAHRPAELRYMEFGLAAAIRAGIPRARILNFRPVEELLAWATSLRG